MKDLMKLQYELEKAIPYLGQWEKQNNYQDRLTNFIYKTDNFKEVKRKAEENNVSLRYTLHRWYNFHTSITAEDLFIKYGAIKEKDTTHKSIDLYIKEIPYDIKLTVYPFRYNKDVNLHTRSGKNDLIKWLYKNQSQQGRKHLKNRLFIVCKDANNYRISLNNLKLKCRFDLIEKGIKTYFNYYGEGQFNKLKVIDDGNEYEVFSDIIVVSR